MMRPMRYVMRLVEIYEAKSIKDPGGRAGLPTVRRIHRLQARLSRRGTAVAEAVVPAFQIFHASAAKTSFVNTPVG
jgi:hypothetical protein